MGKTHLDRHPSPAIAREERQVDTVEGPFILELGTAVVRPQALPHQPLHRLLQARIQTGSDNNTS
jgi:hypothetical protein